MTPREMLAALLAEARAIEEEDRDMCRRDRAIRGGLARGRPGRADALQRRRTGHGRLRHGAGACSSPPVEAGKRLHVYADETRPLLQGARLTAWELQQRGIDVTLICDSMAAQVMREGRVQAVVTGADRIAANGDTANKIGTYGVAAAGRAPTTFRFTSPRPTSTFDLSIAGGEQIPIEQRDPREITHGFGRQTAPDGIEVYNPAFDVTPARLIRPSSASAA